MGKGDNAGYKHFFLFLQYFQKASCTELLKVVGVWLRVICLLNNKIYEHDSPN